MNIMVKNYRTADRVADYFLASVDSDAGDFMSHLKLQKLCYLAQGFHLALYDTPLFDSEIQAWAHGPVVIDLYQRFKKHKWNPIGFEEVKKGFLEDLSKQERELLSQIWIQYGQLSAKQLEMFTHQHSAWKNVYGDRPIGKACYETISLNTMKACFKELLQN